MNETDKPLLLTGRLWDILRETPEYLIILTATAGAYGVAYLTQLGRFHYFALPPELIVVDFQACAHGIWQLTLGLLLVSGYYDGGSTVVKKWKFHHTSLGTSLLRGSIMGSFIGLYWSFISGRWQFIPLSMILSAFATLLLMAAQRSSESNTNDFGAVHYIGFRTYKIAMASAVILLVSYIVGYQFARRQHLRFCDSQGRMFVAQTGDTILFKSLDRDRKHLLPEVTILTKDEVAKLVLFQEGFPNLQVLRLESKAGISALGTIFEPTTTLEELSALKAATSLNLGGGEPEPKKNAQ